MRTDWDAGFIEGRQYGRGKTGGQVRIRNIDINILNNYLLKVRDEYRTDYDAGRGGYGKIVQQKMGTEVPAFLR